MGTLHCAHCGQGYHRKPSDVARSRYCSRRCMTAAKTVTYRCERCGVERTVPSSETRQRFCSDPCRLAWFSDHFRADRSPHWQGGGIRYYGPNWRAQRNKARYRDGHRCQRCGKHRDDLPEELSVAHRIPFRDFGIDRYREANALANLTSLCRRCHIKHDWEEGHRT